MKEFTLNAKPSNTPSPSGSSWQPAQPLVLKMFPPVVALPGKATLLELPEESELLLLLITELIEVTVELLIDELTDDTEEPVVPV